MLRTLVLFAGLGLVPKVVLATPGPVSFAARDGVTIYAVTYGSMSAATATILLFHQADSAKSEYATIAPRLAELGYNVVAIDQRSGGDLYPPGNETVRHLGKSAPYLSVLVDMDAALAYAQRRFPASRIYAWGSSYSAALAFAFAAKHPRDIAAVVAFSPAEYFGDKQFVHDAARHLKIPVFIDSAADAAEERAARAIYETIPARVKVDFVPKHGIHGSSTLREDRNPDGAAENWDAVTAFLQRIH